MKDQELENWIRNDAKEHVEAFRDQHDLKIKSICRSGLTELPAKQMFIGSNPIIDSKSELRKDLEEIAPVIAGLVISFILGYLACKYQYLD